MARSAEAERILAIDPGRDKCGLAVVDRSGAVAAQAVVPTPEAAARIAEWQARWQAGTVVMGKGTGSRPLWEALRAAGFAPVAVEETGTTLRARALYFRDHPPRGWRRLIPLQLQTPPVPLDDYAAVLIADNYLRQASARASGD